MHLVVKPDLYPDQRLPHGFFLSDGENEIEIRNVESIGQTLGSIRIQFTGGEITLDANHALRHLFPPGYGLRTIDSPY